MVDKAFDAFSQRRNTGTRDKLTERTKVETYNDPNRYQMPPRRRLGVVATNRDTTVTPEKTNVTRLAESLSAVTPTLMDIVVNNNVKQNKEQIQLGIKDAAARAAFNNKDPEYVDNEWRKYGYEQHKAFMQGEDLGIQLQEAVQFKPVEQSWDEFYENWWAEQNKLNPNLAIMNPEHVDQFNRALQPGITRAKTLSMAEQVNAKEEAIKETAVDYVTKDLYVQLSEGRELDNRYLTSVRDHIMGFHHSGQEASDFIFEAISNVINDENIDLVDARNLVKLLKTDRGENGEIASYFNTKNKETVALLDEITRRSNAKVQADNAKMTAINSELTSLQTESKKFIKSKANIEASLTDDALGIDVKEKLIESWGNVEKELNEYARNLRPLVQKGEITVAEFNKKYIELGEILLDREGIRSEASAKSDDRATVARQDQQFAFNQWLVPPNAKLDTDTFKGKKEYQIIEAVKNGEDPNKFFAGTVLTWETLTEDQKQIINLIGKNYYNQVTVGSTKMKLVEEIRAKDFALENTKSAKQIENDIAATVQEDLKTLEEKEKDLEKQIKVSQGEQDIIDNNYPVDPNTGVAAKNDIAIDHSEAYRKEQEQLKLAHYSRAKQYEWNQSYMAELNSWHESSPDFLVGDWENDPELQQELQEFHGSNTVAEDAPYVPFSMGPSVYAYDYESNSNVLFDLPEYKSIDEKLEEYFGFNKHSKNKEKSAAEHRALVNDPVKNVMAIKNWYEDKGYRPEAVGAILGNIAHETGRTFDWKQIEDTKEDRNKGWGIFQLDHKMTQYKQFLKQEGAQDSLEMQMLFMHETIYGGWQHVPGYGNAKKLREVMETGTLEEITKAFEDLWEKPKPGSSAKRKEEAQALHSNLY